MSDRSATSAEDVLRLQSHAFRASMDGMAILDADERYVFLNDAHARLYGYEAPEALLGQSWRVLYSPEQLRRFEVEVLPALWREGRWRGEAVGLRRDGTSFPQELSLTTVEGGGLVCVVRDTTDSKRAERVQAALYRIAEAAENVQDMGSLYASIHGIVGELMWARNFYIALYDGFNDLLSFPYFVDEVDVAGPPARPGRGLTEYVLRTGESLLASPEVFARLIEEGEVEAVGVPGVDWLGVPLKRGETSFGVLVVQSYTESLRYVEADRDLLTFVSRHIAAVIDRRRSEDALRESEEKFRTLAETAPAAIFIYQGQRFLYANEATSAITGYPRDEFLTLSSLWEIVHPEDKDDVKRRGMEGHEGEGAPIRYEVRIVRKDGEERWLDYSAATVEYGGRPAVMGTAFDITERKRAEEQISSLAYHDTLTGLPNRLLFSDRLEQAILQAQRRTWRLGVLFLDLDRFKVINDSLGHGVGDRLLQALARRIASTLRSEDTVARLGGDEFTLLLPNIGRVDDVTLVAEKLLDSVRRPVRIDGSELFVTASIGISLFPDDGDDPDTLVKNADTAMYRAKELGRDNYQLYAAAMNATALERLALETSFRKALTRDELVLYYQPILDLATGEAVGVEALLRWNRPDVGLVSPLDFIPMAEATGLILPVGSWLLNSACSQVRRWHETLRPDLRLAVNLSARQFQQPDVAGLVQRALRAAEFPAECLDLEITESWAMQNADAAILTMRELKSLGVSLSIDDFGIGYSSLSYLKRFPIDKLKIDRSFVHDIPGDPDDAAIVAAVLALARSLKLKVVAEGVETEEQREFLAVRGCDQAQGYLFGPPLPAEDCERLLRSPRV
ncbi:MAG TPA: EAL domain-containing protein [Vicinamibacteria bacterium]|nr:EAL domain-containing protein [Vicinamibacteria bacterium]